MTSAAVVHLSLVSDIACPWCAVGLASLDQALANIGDEIDVQVQLQPFELNPDMPAEGQDANDYIMRKYNMDAAQRDASRALIRERAVAVGFTYNVGEGSRVWNTFDAHRLLHWLSVDDAQAALALKRALFRAFFTHNQNISSAEVLLACVAECGLAVDEAAQVLSQQRYADDVRLAERQIRQTGVRSVPALIVNDTFLISGGQPPEVFEEAIRNIASGAVQAPPR